MLNAHLNSFLIGDNLKFLSMRSFRKGFLWEVEKKKTPVFCKHCCSHNTVRAGRCTTTVKEDPVRQTNLWLKIHKHRIYCKDCKSTFGSTTK